MKKFLTVLFLSLSACSVFGQQSPRVSNLLFNRLALNPAVAGIEDFTSIKASYRSQWVGLEGAPTTSQMAVSGPLNLAQMGWGLMFTNDQITAFTDNSLVGFYSYHFRLKDDRSLSFGIGGGIKQSGFQLDKINQRDQGDIVFPTSNSNIWLPDSRLGFYYQTLTGNFGVSIDNLYKGTINFSGIARPIEGEQVRHLRASYGKLFYLRDDLSFSPNLLVRINEKFNYQVDFTTIFTYNNVFDYGFTYRHKESVVFLLNYAISPQLSLGYSFDFTTSQLYYHNNGSHEITLSYRLFPNKGIMLNPRYFFNNY